MTKRAIVKKNGGGFEDFENLSKQISEISKKTGVDITYVSVSTSPSYQELLIKGERDAVNNCMSYLKDNGLLIREELLIPL